MSNLNNHKETVDIHLQISLDQLQAIQIFFHEQGWDYAECEILEESSKGDCDDSSDSGEELNINPLPEEIIPAVENEEECQYCYCTPCITNETNRQQWWSNGPSPPHRLNTIHRKALYKRFWTMMYNRGAWHDDRYLTKKSIALGDRRRHHWIHRRDIMPNCVLKVVRLWLPNLEGVPYMDHLWE